MAVLSGRSGLLLGVLLNLAALPAGAADKLISVDVALGVGNRGRAGGPPPVYERTAALLRQLMAARPPTGGRP